MKKNKDPESKIFISYAKPDRKSVRLVYDKLKNEGFTPWMDIMDIKAGEIWENVIEQAIKDSAFFLVFMSKNSG